jgi:hypothetical protein
MKMVLRQTLAIVTGMIIALASVTAVEIVNSVVYPPPPGFTNTEQEICELVSTYPQWLLALDGLAWAVGAFLSTWVAALIAGRIPGVIVAIVLLAALGFNLSMLPYVAWFKILMPIALLVGCYLGVTLGRRRLPPTTISA